MDWTDRRLLILSLTELWADVREEFLRQNKKYLNERELREYVLEVSIHTGRKSTVRFLKPLLEPLLFLAYVDDLPDEQQSYLDMFTENT